MPVTSTTLAGVNVWRLSGNVTDAELKTAWAGIITNNRYLLNRTIYVDDTCSLANVRGTYYIDSQNLGIILHSSRNKANTLFRNWFFTQTVGLSVGARSNFVRFTNGTTISNSSTDGIDMQGGGMMYAVVGNPGGGDPRFLNEMMFGSLDGALVTSAAWTEQEIEPNSIGTIWRGLNIQKAGSVVILPGSGGLQRQVIYRSNFNTEGAALRLLRPFSNNSICMVSSIVRRQGNAVTSNLADTFGSNGSAVIMFLNNFRDESYFGASKTNLNAANWNAGNRFIGGVMKKIQVQPSTLIRTYDSRSTTTSQKSTFSETTQDFLTGTDSTTSDPITGRAQFVCVGAVATGASIAITRHTGQRFTLQKFGYRVQVEAPDMTFGDDDLSAFSPITMAVQDGVVRTQAAITAATTINSFQDLLEELHVLAIGLSGEPSYAGAFNGNLFNFVGDVLTTSFASVTIDATAPSKITYNAATNALTIKSSVMTSNATVARWNNASGTVTLANGAVVQGVYQSSVGVSKVVSLTASAGSSVYIGDNATGVTTLYQADVAAGAFEAYYAPSATAPTVLIARELYGFQRFSQVVTLANGLNTFAPPDIPDVGVTEAVVATVLAYTEIETPSKRYDRTAAFRLTEQGIKLGQIATRSGTSIEGTFSVVVRDDAPAVYGVASNVITIKAGTYAGDSKYSTEIVTGGGTFTAFDTEVITIAREDANGNSQVTIQATGANMFEIWKIPNATNPDNFATGTLLATVPISTFRFIAAPGFKMVIRDTTTNFRVVVTMDKGVYLAELFFGAAVQLAQSAEVSQINTKVDILQNDLEAVKGAAFDTNQHSLVRIKKSADFAGAISA